MRLKASERPIAVHNQNNDILNSPKRINTLENSRYISSTTTSNLVGNCPRNIVRNNTNNFFINKTTLNSDNTDRNILNSAYYNSETTGSLLNGSDLTSSQILNNITNGANNETEENYFYDVDNLTKLQRLNGGVNDTQELRWCNTTNLTPHQFQNTNQYPSNAINNRNLATARNINTGNLAAQTQSRIQRQALPKSEYSLEPPSPDDVLIRDDLESRQSYNSSTSASPDDEEGVFDASDPIELSDEENDPLGALKKQRLRCIVNPNYPGFQHLAHTLIDGYTDENLTFAVDNNANNNNTEEDQIDKFDNINRLDSIENIQKVFCDKSVLDIQPIELGDSPSSTAQELVDSTISIDQNTLVESTTSIEQDLTTDNNLVESTASLDGFVNSVSGDEKNVVNENVDNIDAKEKLSSGPEKKSSVLVYDKENVESDEYNIVGDFRKEVEDELDRVAISAEQFEDQLKELELVADKLKKITDASPTVLKQYFEPNCSEPFEKINQNEPKENKLELKKEPKVLKTTEESGLYEPDFPQTKESYSPKTVEENESSLTKPREVVRPSTLDLPVKHIKRPLESSIFPLDDESAEDLKAEQLIMSAKLFEISRTPTYESNYEEQQKILDLREDSKSTFESISLSMTNKMVDAALSSAKENLPKISVRENIKNVDKNEKKREWIRYDEYKKMTEGAKSKCSNNASMIGGIEGQFHGVNKEDSSKHIKEKDVDSSQLSKKTKFSNYIRRRIDYGQQFGSLIAFPRKENVPRRENLGKNRDPLIRRSVPIAKSKRGTSSDALGGFDVYNIETAMPKIDMEAIESHLKAAKEEERRRRTDREEIRRRLAMGSEDDYYSDRPGRKPSLQSRLQSGMNLQICFMNETVSDMDSPTSDSESPVNNPKQLKFNQNLNRSVANNVNSRTMDQDRPQVQRPATLPLQPAPTPNLQSTAMSDTDFFAKQARLQTEARMALAQAKEMARMQMEIEKQRQKKSPITEMVRNSLQKVGIPFPEEKRRLSRQILTEMNVAQLQVIVNDLHTQIETLNENLVKFLMDRDDLHMEQDSMLVDIEDLTRYLSAKEQVIKDHSLAPTPQNNNLPPPSPAPPSPLQSALNNTVRPHLHRIANLVKK